MDTKDFKELEIILSSYQCDKKCPYCTAKITRWREVEDDIHMLFLNVGQMRELGYSFHYVTLGGNGEPTLHPYQKLKDIVEMFDGWDIPVKRVLTSGNVFREEEKEKYDLFVQHGWIFEVTVADSDMEKSNAIQGYDFDYMQTDAFKSADVRLNYVMLFSNFNGSKFLKDIDILSGKFPNIRTFALKILNINTFNGKVDNIWSQWIVDNGIPKDMRDDIADILNHNFIYEGENYDTHSWRTPNGVEIYFSWKKVLYGSYDLVWYGNRFVTYQVEDAHINLLPKVYIASRFIKEKLPDGLSFADDFRAKLIGVERDFINFNNHSFIRNGRVLLAQYIGPFYNEKAGDGKLTSTDCEKVVSTENSLVERCDVFVCYLDEVLSPGGINELTYAACLHKKIIIFYKEEAEVGYATKTSSWYPITFASLVAPDCRMISVDSSDEVIERLPEILSGEN